jgi:hypothetical protein
MILIKALGVATLIAMRCVEDGCVWGVEGCRGVKEQSHGHTENSLVEFVDRNSEMKTASKTRNRNGTGREANEGEGTGRGSWRVNRGRRRVAAGGDDDESERRGR